MNEIRFDPTPRRIRARLGTKTIADSTRAQLVYAVGRHPEYMVPLGDVAWAGLTVDDDPRTDALGDYHGIRHEPDGGRIGRRYVDGHAAGLVQLDFAAMDAWFEEDEQIWFHPRDPFRRVDVIESSRHVKIVVDGVTVAESDRPRLVTETGLPERWYLPRADVDWSTLDPSDTTSNCQYKGIAGWWNVSLASHDSLADVAWGYERPVPEASKLAGLVAFYAEHAEVETVVDGVAQPKPEFDPTWLNPSLHITNLETAAI
jgi:uncharacterized protein (DUF427 family)